MRTWYAVLIALVTASLMVVGTPPPPGNGAAAPREIVIAQGLFPVSLDPAVATDQATLNVVEQINEPLLLWTPRAGLRPYLATSWKAVSPTVWEVQLRHGVKFTDGEELTADVVKFNWQRLQDPNFKPPNWPLARGISDIGVVDKYTVRFTTQEPDPVFPLRSLSELPLVPMTYVQQHGNQYFAEHPVGTGPYKFVEKVTDERVVLEANPGYWRGKPSLDKVTFLSIPEASSRMAALQTGAADLVTLVNIDDVPRLTQAGLHVVSEPSLRVMHVILDTLHGGPTADKRVRQALNYAIDKDALIKYVVKGYGAKVQGQMLSKDYFGFNPSLQAFPYDPARAKKLLAEAGYPNGLTLTFYTPHGRYMADQQIADAIAGQLKNVGITANEQTLEWGTYIQKLQAKQLTPMAFLGLALLPDADLMLQEHLCGETYSYYCNKQFDALVLAARHEINPEKRKQLYWQATALEHDDPPVIYLWQQVDLYGLTGRVKNWHPRPDEMIDLWGVSTSGS